MIYPTDDELEIISKWDFRAEPVQEFIDYIVELWWQADILCKIKGKNVMKLWLSTAGWSGNEDIIHAVRKNSFFWSMCWEWSKRGGHYKFSVDLRWFGK